MPYTPPTISPSSSNPPTPSRGAFTATKLHSQLPQDSSVFLKGIKAPNGIVSGSKSKSSLFDDLTVHDSLQFDADVFVSNNLNGNPFKPFEKSSFSQVNSEWYEAEGDREGLTTF